MKAYYNENKFYNHLEEWVGAVLLAVMVVMLFVQVVMRYIFKASAAWISEYSLYMLKEAAHLFLYVVDFLFVTVVGYYVFLRVIDQFQMKTVSITQFPLWIMSASLFVGMGASAIRCLMNIYFIIRYEFISGREGE